jgi:uncharacterized protein
MGRHLRESCYNIWVETEGAAYVFNGMSGALLCVPNKEYRALKTFLAGEQESNCSVKLLEQLIIGRMLIADKSDEIDILERRYAASRNNPSNFVLTIVTSLGCNFDCPYCFEAKHPSIMDRDVQQAVLQILNDQLPKISSFSVSWFGGEPLVGRKPLLALSDAFIERCDRANVGYSATIATNGFLLDEQTCADLRDRRVLHAQVCLDGPPDVHDRMRPQVNGSGSFWHIVRNLHHAIRYFDVSVRMNVDTQNFGCAEELLRILASEGFSDKLAVYPGQIVTLDDGASPSSSYRARCFKNPEFARAEREFFDLAISYGFAQRSLPRPTGAPCTAVRRNELVVGSKGELYKCWESIGNRLEVVGDVRDYQNPNGRLQRWIKYDPFTNAECRSCIALPVCMGGCAHHAMDARLYENRCGTFRHTYQEQVLSYVKDAERRGFANVTVPGQLARQIETR